MSRNQDGRNARPRRAPKSSIRPGLEQLESRLVPAKVVTTILDTTNPSSPTPGSLRAALTLPSPADRVIEFNDYLFAASVGTTHNPTSLALGDFRGTGKTDVVSASAFLNNFYLATDNGNGFGILNRGNPLTPNAATANITAIETANLNSGTVADIITVQSDGFVRAYTGSGTGVFSAAGTVGLGGTATGLVVGDFNADSKADFATVLTGATGTVVYALGNGDGTFGALQTISLTNGNQVAIGLADVTGDLKADLVAFSSNGVLTTLPGNGAGFDAEVTSSVAGTSLSYTLALGDLNADGKADAVVVNRAAGTVSTLLGSSTAAFTPGSVVTLPTGAQPGVARVADFTGDGNADVAVTQYGLNSVAVYSGKGDGSFNPVASTFDVVAPTDIRVADMNPGFGPDRDAFQDLVVASETTQSFAVFMNNGSGVFSPVASKQATFILNGAVGSLNDTLTNDIRIFGGAQFGANTFDTAGNSLANKPRVLIQADVGFDLGDYDLTGVAGAVLGTGFRVNDILTQGTTSTSGGARFQVLAVDGAGGVTSLRVLQPGSQTTYDQYGAGTGTVTLPASLSTTGSTPLTRLVVTSGTGSGLSFPTGGFSSANRTSGLFFQNTPGRLLTLDGLGLNGAFDNTVILTQGNLSLQNVTFTDIDNVFSTARGNIHFVRLQTGAGNLTVNNSRFDDSQVDAINGASNGTISITGSTFTNMDGQALTISAGTVTIDSSLFLNNGDRKSQRASKVFYAPNTANNLNMSAAGKITASNKITVTNSIFDSNNDAFIPSEDRSLKLTAVSGSVTIGNSIFRNNVTNGALEVDAQQAVITNSWFDGNAAPMYFNGNSGAGDQLRGGSAVLIRGGTNLTLTGDKFTNNTADNINSRFSGGGAIYINNGPLTIDQCAFEGNVARITSNFPGSETGDYMRTTTPANGSPEKAPAAKYSGGGALYAGGATIIRDSYFANNSLLSFVDLWQPTASEATELSQPQYSGGGAVYLSRNIDTATSSDIFNTTFVDNFAQQVEANKDITRAGAQRQDQGLGTQLYSSATGDVTNNGDGQNDQISGGTGGLIINKGNGNQTLGGTNSLATANTGVVFTANLDNANGSEIVYLTTTGNTSQIKTVVNLNIDANNNITNQEAAGGATYIDATATVTENNVAGSPSARVVTYQLGGANGVNINSRIIHTTVNTASITSSSGTQTFTVNADGSLAITPSTLAIHALSGSINLSTGLVTVVWNTAAPGATTITATYSKQSITDFAMGDYEADGLPEFAFGTNDNKVRITRNNFASGNNVNTVGFSTNTTFTTTGTPVSIGMGKFDGAGDDVAVLVNNNGTYIVNAFVYDSTDPPKQFVASLPNANITTASLNAAGVTLTNNSPTTKWTKLVTGDFNRNGDNAGIIDIACFSPTDNRVAIITNSYSAAAGFYSLLSSTTNVSNLNTLINTAIKNQLYATGTTVESLNSFTAADMNNDSIPDFIISVKLNNGTNIGRPTDAMAILTYNGNGAITTTNVYLTSPNRADALDKTLFLRETTFDESDGATTTLRAEPAFIGKALAGTIYLNNQALQSYTISPAGTVTVDRPEVMPLYGNTRVFVTGGTFNGATGVITLNWNAAPGANHASVRVADHQTVVTAASSQTVSVVLANTLSTAFPATTLPLGTPARLEGTVTVGGTLVQRFTVNGDGSLNLTQVGSPATFAASGSLTLATGVLTLNWNNAPNTNVDATLFAEGVTALPAFAATIPLAANANTGFLFVNGGAVQTYTVGSAANGVASVSFRQIPGATLLYQAVSGSLNLATGVLTVNWNRDLPAGTVILASITNTASATTTLYNPLANFVSQGTMTGTIYAGNQAVQTFTTSNTVTETSAVDPGTTAIILFRNTVDNPNLTPVYGTLTHPVSDPAQVNLTGSIFVGGTLIQTYSYNGTAFTFTPVAVTTVQATAGLLNPLTGNLTFTFNQAPGASTYITSTYKTSDLVFQLTRINNTSTFVTDARYDALTKSVSLAWNTNPGASRMEVTYNKADFITNSQPITVAGNEFNTTHTVAAAPVAKGSLSGTIYLGTMAIQTFTVDVSGTTFTFSNLRGTPAVRATGGNLDPDSGTINLFWNQSLEGVNPTTPPTVVVTYARAYNPRSVAAANYNNIADTRVDIVSANANQSASAYFGNGAGGLPNIPATGRGLNGGAILIADGRQVVPNVAKAITPRPGSMAVRVYNTTIVANNLINPYVSNADGALISTSVFDPTRGSKFGGALGSNYLAVAQTSSQTYAHFADVGGLFNDTNAGSSIALLNTVVVNNSGIGFAFPGGAPSLTQADMGQPPTAYSPGNLFSQGSTLFRPSASLPLNALGVIGDIIQSDQQVNFDSFELVDTDNFRPTLVGPTVTGIGSAQYQISETDTQKIKYLPLSRLSPARDGGASTIGGVSVVGLLNSTGTDTRGANRAVNNAIDLGSFEVQLASRTDLRDTSILTPGNPNPTVTAPFEYGQPITLELKTAWNDNVLPTAAVTGTVSLIRVSDDQILGASIYGTAVNPSDISTGKYVAVVINPGSAGYSTLLNIGTNSVYGSYGGDTNYAASQTNPFNIVITQATTSVGLAAQPTAEKNAAFSITGTIDTPQSVATLLSEGTIRLEYRVPDATGFAAGSFVTLPGAAALTPTLTGDNSTATFQFDVPTNSVDFSTLGRYEIRATFVSGGPNHYKGAVSAVINKDIVVTPTITFEMRNATNTGALAQPVTRGDTFYLRATLTPGDNNAVLQGGAVNFVKSNGTAFNLTAVSSSIVGTDRVYDYKVDTSTPGFSLPAAPNNTLLARYTGYVDNQPATAGFYRSAETGTQTLVIVGRNPDLAISSSAVSPIRYGQSATYNGTLTGTTGVKFDGGVLSLSDNGSAVPGATYTLPAASPSGVDAVNSQPFTVTPAVGNHLYDLAYSGDGFNYEPRTGVNIGTPLALTVDKADTVSSPVGQTIYAGLGASVPLAVTLSNSIGALPPGLSLPTGTVNFFATVGASRILLGTTTNNDPASGVFTFNYTTTAGGNYPITIDYSGDGNYLGLSSQAFGTLVVPTLTLDLGGNPANVSRGAVVNFTATVAPSGTALEQPGDVTFRFNQGSTLVASVTIPRNSADPGVYLLSAQLGSSALDLANGTYTVTASYAPGAGQYPAMVSSERTLNVGLSDTITTLAASTVSGQYRYGENISLAATVDGAVGLPFLAPGAVSIYDGVTNLTPGGLPIVAANTTTDTVTRVLDTSALVSALPVGAHNFQARYSGDGTNYIASNSTVRSVTVVKASTIATMSGILPASGIVASGSALTLSVTVGVPAYVEANAARPTGTVVFATGGATLGTATVDAVTGLASITINPSALGNFTFTAQYSGDTNYDISTTGSTYTVAAISFAPVAVGAQARNIIQRGEPLTLSASVTPAVGAGSATPTGVVQFLIPGTTDTVVTTVPYNPSSGGVYTTTIDTGNPAFSLPVGNYNLVARYIPASGDSYPLLNSVIQTLTVGRQAVTLAGALGSTSIVYGTALALTAASIDAGLGVGSSIPFAAGQTVDLYDGQALVAQIPFSNTYRVLNLPTTKLEAGVHNLQLRYGGDANYLPATLDLAPLTVTQAATNLTLVTSAGNLRAGLPFTFTAQVSSPQLGLPSSPTGTVLFSVTLAGAQVSVGQATLSQVGQATFSFTPAAAGAFVVTATYSGDRNFSATGASDSETVVASALTMGAISPNVVNLGARIRLTALMAPAGDGLFTQNGSVDFILPNGLVVGRATLADSQVTSTGRLYTKDVDSGIAANNLRAGNASIRAIYVPGAGDPYPAITTDARTVVINRQPTETILTASPLSGVVFGTSVSFTMTAAPRVAAGNSETTIPFADGGHLSLYDGSSLLQRLPVSGSTASVTFSVPALTGGQHNLTAVYSGDAVNFNASTSSALVLDIAKAATTLTVSPTTGATIQVGTATKITATLSTAVTAASPTGKVQFSMGGAAIGSPVALSGNGASITYTPTRSGMGALTATYLGDGNFAQSSASGSLQFRARQPFFVVASQAGSTFMTYDSRTGRALSTFQPLGPSYKGGFRVATGDVSGDGVADLAYTTSTGSFVRIINGLTGSSLGGFYAYAANYTKPVNLAIADINGDGRGDIITAPGAAGVAANVRVFSGSSYGLLFNKTVFTAGFKGGVSVAGGDVNGDGKADIICTPYSGGGPRVQVYSGANGALLRDQVLFATTSTSGYSVIAEDLNRDGKAEIVLAGMAGAQQVVVSDGATGALAGSFLPFSPGFTGGTRLATVDDIDGDGIRDIIAASGPNGQSQVRRFSGRTLTAIDGFFAYAAANAARNKGLFAG